MLPRATSQLEERYRMLSGHCPDEKCQTKLYFPSYDSSIECTGCGQRHERGALRDVQEVTDPEVALHNMVRNLLVGNVAPKQTADSVKVLGLSNYHCKLLSPLLTYYGMDKQGKAQPLTALSPGGREVFDCSLLGGRAFLLQPEHVGIMGYGRDQTGSARYLGDTLQFISQLNGDQEVLIPIHADGDGHCLVHGISRALVGRELFWHALRTNLKAHFLANINRYKDQFKDFLTADSEWAQIITESDPDYLPSETEAFGLQNIHIFGLANVLHRPIILLDSLKGLQSPGDYSGVFLPVFVPVKDCRGKDGSLNKPLCIAWSSSGRNHFIALVGVKGRPVPRLPRWMLTKAWGTPHELIDTYIQFDQDDMCMVGGERSLPDKYVQRLAAAMEEVFAEKYHLHPAVVADVHHYIYKRTGVVGVHQNIVIDNTRYAVENEQLFRCLLCGALSQIKRSPPPPAAWLQPGGKLYNLVRTLHGRLLNGKVYAFPQHELNFVYDASKDELVPDQTSISPTQCAWCQGKQLRQIRADGSVVYYNGDRTATPAPKTKCNCGFKHYWNGQEYDNNPAIFSVPLKWKGQSYEEEVLWFQEESDPVRNSNAYAIASALVQKHYPADFGSEKLVQQVVETILQNTAAEQEEYQPISLKDMPSTSSVDQSAAGSPTSSHGGTTPESRRGGKPDRPASSPACARVPPRAGSPRDKKGKMLDSPRDKKGKMLDSPRDKKGKMLDDSPSKIILTGHASKTLHKEELTMSEAERNLRKRIQEKAPVAQQRHPSSKEPGKHQQSPDPSDAPTTTAAQPKTDAPTTTAAQPKTDAAREGPSDRETDRVSVVVMDTVAAATKEAPKQKRIRLSSPDGKQATLVLEPSTTYAELQVKIEAELRIPVAEQRIRYGFPPKELAPPDGDRANEPVPLQNGDKVTVEVITSKGQPMDTGPSERAQHSLSSVPGSSTFPEGRNRFTSREDIMRGMEMLQKETGDNLDLQLYSLNLMATLTGTDMWTYVQRNAPLFERGGLFYAIVDRDLGLADGKHFMLPSIPNKKFTYNAMEDRVELCLEPVGHFPVRPGLDDTAEGGAGRPGRSATAERPEEEEAAPRPGIEELFPASVRSKLKAGGSGVVTSGGQQAGGYRAFSGHAHTLAAGGGAAATATATDSRPGPAVGWEASRWAQYQREFNEMLEQRERKVASAQVPARGGSPAETVELPAGSPQPQAARGTEEEPPLSDRSPELGARPPADPATCDAGGGSGRGEAGRPGGTDAGAHVSDQEMEHSRSPDRGQAREAAGESATEGDALMDVDAEALPAPSSPLPMDVDAAADPPDEGGGATVHSNSPPGHSAKPAPLPTPPSLQPTDKSPAEKPPSSSSSSEESSPVYVAKRLGPGYTVLVEQPASEPLDSNKGDPPGQKTSSLS